RRPLSVGKRRKALAELDHVAVAVLPVVEEVEVGEDVVDGHSRLRGTGIETRHIRRSVARRKPLPDDHLPRKAQISRSGPCQAGSMSPLVRVPVETALSTASGSRPLMRSPRMRTPVSALSAKTCQAAEPVTQTS